MTKHKGEHPRMGAIDVVPFVPVKNISMEECIKISEAYAERASKELNIPIYLYEAAARKPERQNLANIRKGEYEGLAEKLKDKNWQPDYGTNEFSPKLGGTVTGARFFLIAYNVNLKSEDVKYAKEIGEILRESGYFQWDEAGNIIKVNGQPVKVPGKLKSVKGMGVALEKYKMTQVSMNLTNYNITPIHVAFEEVKKEAARLGVEVTGSEIVGLVPLDALFLAGKYYSPGKNLDEKSLVEGAVGAAGRVEELADLIVSPVFTTVSGRGVLPEDHELALGFDFNRGSVHVLNEMILQSDCVLAIGCKLTQPGTGGYQLELPSDRLVRVDTSEEVLGANYPARLAIPGSAEDVLDRLVPALRALRKMATGGWSPDVIKEWKKRLRIVPSTSSVLDPVIHGVTPANAGAFFAVYLTCAVPVMIVVKSATVSEAPPTSAQCRNPQRGTVPHPRLVGDCCDGKPHSPFEAHRNDMILTTPP